MKIYSIHTSKQAKADLKEIFNYILKVESRERAKYVINGIKKEIEKTAIFPTKHPRVPYYGQDNMRFTVKWSYKIVFTIEADTVQVVSIFHTAQNPDKLRDLS